MGRAHPFHHPKREWGGSSHATSNGVVRGPSISENSSHVSILMLITLDNDIVRGQSYGSESMSWKTRDIVISRMAPPLLDEQSNKRTG